MLTQQKLIHFPQYQCSANMHVTFVIAYVNESEFDDIYSDTSSFVTGNANTNDVLNRRKKKLHLLLLVLLVLIPAQSLTKIYHSSSMLIALLWNITLLDKLNQTILPLNVKLVISSEGNFCRTRRLNFTVTGWHHSGCMAPAYLETLIL